MERATLPTTAKCNWTLLLASWGRLDALPLDTGGYQVRWGGLNAIYETEIAFTRKPL